MSAPAGSATDLAHLVRLPGEGASSFGIPHSNYVLQLMAPPGDAGKVQGRIQARALKMHLAQGGGVFIEPLQGAPRIVQGRVLATDAVTNRVLANVVVPMWISVPEGQAASAFRHGDLVNFYVESGARLEPA